MATAGASREAAINDVYTERNYVRHGSDQEVLDWLETWRQRNA
jgi:hypothetical protein